MSVQRIIRLALVCLAIFTAACTPEADVPQFTAVLIRGEGQLTLTYPETWAAESSNATNVLLGSSAEIVAAPPGVFDAITADQFLVNILLAVPSDIQYPVSPEDAISLERMTALNIAAASQELGRDAVPTPVQAGGFVGTRATFQLRDQDVTILLFQLARGDFYVSMFARTAPGGWAALEMQVLGIVETFVFERRSD